MGWEAKNYSAFLRSKEEKSFQVESVKRTLESAQQESFSVLRLAANDRNCCLVLTCRDYSVETVKAAFLDFVGLSCDIVKFQNCPKLKLPKCF